MPLIYVGKHPHERPWFAPDRIVNFRHDAKEGMNIVVYDKNGVAVCGRFVEGAREKWGCRLEDCVLEDIK
jgi:hypothetical protein